MTFLGLELNAGLTASFALAVLGVLWNYSSLPEMDWTEVAAGVMSFLAGAGIELLNSDPGLQVFLAADSIALLVAVLYVVGGLLVAVGGLKNGVQALSEEYM